MTWPGPDCRARLAEWLQRRLRDAATVDDLLQETLLHTVVVAARRGVTDTGTVEKFAWGVARNLLARERRRGTKGLTNQEQALASRRALELPEEGLPATSLPQDLACATREHLLSIRAPLEAELRKGQRALLALYVDEGITSVRGLARRLDLDPADIRRRLHAIAQHVLRLT